MDVGAATVQGMDGCAMVAVDETSARSRSPFVRGRPRHAEFTCLPVVSKTVGRHRAHDKTAVTVLGTRGLVKKIFGRTRTTAALNNII